MRARSNSGAIFSSYFNGDDRIEGECNPTCNLSRSNETQLSSVSRN